MTKNVPAPTKGRRTSKRISSLESRTQRLADAIRKKHSTLNERIDFLEQVFLDFLAYQGIEVSQLIEANGDEDE